MYKLLIYCRDFGDEFDVSAINVMSEKEYFEWLEQPTGEFNENYEEEFKAYKAAVDAYQNFVQRMREKGLYNKRLDTFTKEEKEWYEANKKDYVYGNSPHKVVRSDISAWLGNYGDYFKEDFLDFAYNREMVDLGVIQVYDVSEEFVDTFKRVHLNRINLTNVVDFKRSW